MQIMKIKTKRTPNKTPEWYREQIRQAEKAVDSWPEWKRDAAAALLDELIEFVKNEGSQNG